MSCLLKLTLEEAGPVLSAFPERIAMDLANGSQEEALEEGTRESTVSPFR